MLIIRVAHNDGTTDYPRVSSQAAPVLCDMEIGTMIYTFRYAWVVLNANMFVTLYCMA